MLRGAAEKIPPGYENVIDKDIASALSIGVYPPLFHKYRQKHLYVLRFFKAQQWRYVIIDDRLPIYRTN